MAVAKASCSLIGQYIMRKSASDPIGTLSVANVINAAVSLYKSNFRDFFTLSLRSLGWILLGIICWSPVLAVAFAINNIGITIAAAVVCLAISMFFFAKSFTSRGVIARIAYQQLINQPESLSSATSQLANSHWKFMRLSLLLSLFMIGVLILAYLALALASGIGVFAAVSLRNELGYFIAVILVLVGIGAFSWILLRFYSFWLVAELPLAVERCAGGLDAIGRSKQLSAPFVSRILMVVLVAFLITIPLNVIAIIPGLTALTQPPASAMYFVLQGLNVAVSLLLELFIMPFWQAIKAVVYFDLRSRLEGADLRM
jgi:hypothetical protein